MNKFRFYLLGLSLAATISMTASDKPARQMNYWPDGRDIVCVNGQNKYTRALYGTHTYWRLETSDRPIFATVNNKKDCRNIQLYLIYNKGEQNLTDATFCEARYRGGCRTYLLRDERWPKGAEIRLIAIASMREESALWQAELVGFSTGTQLKAVMSDTKGQTFYRGADVGTDDLTQLDGSGKNKKTAASSSQNSENAENSKSTLLYLILKNNIDLHFLPNDEGQQRMSEEMAVINELTGRVEFTTPDPFINVLGANLVAAADGYWDGQTWLHGCIGWRSPLAGWRGGYVGDALGWNDRSKSHYDAYARSQVKNRPQTIFGATQDEKKNLARARTEWGTGMYSNGYICRLPNRDDLMHHYDMNLNYIDELLWHFCYDADPAYLRKMWPVLKLHLEWEKRNWDPDGDHLYDAYCCIWASDALYYNGGAVTHSTAYNYRGNLLAARIAEIIGEDPKPYANEAAAILKAMNETLWIDDEGHWAEYKDLMGLKRLHKNAALWTIYTPIDCGACSPEQAYRATRWVDENLPRIPIKVASPTGVVLNQLFTFPTTTWMPYDWSTNNVAHEEVANMALAYFQAGRDDDGFLLLKSDLIDGQYLGVSPGNFGQISYYDKARSEAYRDFADNVGITSRALVNGLFGILPDALNGQCVLKPALPESWDSCEVRLPYLHYKFYRRGSQHVYEITQNFPQPLKMVVKTNQGKGHFITTEGTNERTQTIVVNNVKTVAKPSLDDNVPSIWTGIDSPEYQTVMGLEEPKANAKYTMVKMDKYFNSNVDDIFKNDYLTPRPNVTTLQMPKHGIGQWCHPERMATIEDDGFRAKIAGNVFKTGLGELNFISPKKGHNIAYTSLWDNYPDTQTIPVKGKASAAWLLMAGSTNSMQSRIDNGLVIATYTDGMSDTLHLENPINWCPIEQEYYVDKYAFRTAPLQPYRVHLGSGLVSRCIGDHMKLVNWEKSSKEDPDRADTYGIPDGAAQMLRMPLNPEKTLRSLTLRTLSNDVVIGLMAVTLEK